MSYVKRGISLTVVKAAPAALAAPVATAAPAAPVAPAGPAAVVATAAMEAAQRPVARAPPPPRSGEQQQVAHDGRRAWLEGTVRVTASASVGVRVTGILEAAVIVRLMSGAGLWR